MNENPNCDGGRCRSSIGEVRALPWTTDPHGGNSILCRHCFNYEMNYRRERNLDLSKNCQFDLPTWESLRVYLTAEGKEPA